jgi:hypothetical protein
MQMPFQEALVIAVVLLNAYSLGANCVERFVNYQTWPLIGAGAFKTYHKAQQPLIQIFVVAPTAVGFLLQILLLWNVPEGVDLRVLRGMVMASAVGGISTAVLQLPIHVTFNRYGYSPALMRKLLRTDWIRKAADGVRLAATVVLLHEIVRAR